MEPNRQSTPTNQLATFKTNIKCGACVAAVTPYLNEVLGESHWQVDLKSPDRPLVVPSKDATAVQEAVQKAGYKAELLP